MLSFIFFRFNFIYNWSWHIIWGNHLCTYSCGSVVTMATKKHYCHTWGSGVCKWKSIQCVFFLQASLTFSWLTIQVKDGAESECPDTLIIDSCKDFTILWPTQWLVCWAVPFVKFFLKLAMNVGWNCSFCLMNWLFDFLSASNCNFDACSRSYLWFIDFRRMALKNFKYEVSKF